MSDRLCALQALSFDEFFYLPTWQDRILFPVHAQKKINSIAYRKMRVTKDNKMTHFVPEAQRLLLDMHHKKNKSVNRTI